jgi:hypothetical protein
LELPSSLNPSAVYLASFKIGSNKVGPDKSIYFKDYSYSLIKFSIPYILGSSLFPFIGKQCSTFLELHPANFGIPPKPKVGINLSESYFKRRSPKNFIVYWY